MSVQIPSLGAHLCFPGGQASLQVTWSPSCCCPGDWGWEWLLDPPWRAFGRQHSCRKSLSHSEPCVMEGDVYLKNSMSSCSTSGYICKIVFFIHRVKWTGIISFAVVPVEEQAILQEKNYKTN